MYEREHVKRGLIFVREGAYAVEYNLKATDSEGTTRSISIKTGNGSGDSKKDIGTELIAAAMHGCLETKVDDSSGYKDVDKNTSIVVDTDYTYKPWDEHTHFTVTGIHAQWTDDSTNHVFNGDGAADGVTRQ